MMHLRSHPLRLFPLIFTLLAYLPSPSVETGFLQVLKDRLHSARESLGLPIWHNGRKMGTYRYPPIAGKTKVTFDEAAFGDYKAPKSGDYEVHRVFMRDSRGAEHPYYYVVVSGSGLTAKKEDGKYEQEGGDGDFTVYAFERELSFAHPLWLVMQFAYTKFATKIQLAGVYQWYLGDASYVSVYFNRRANKDAEAELLPPLDGSYRVYMPRTPIGAHRSSAQAKALQASGYIVGKHKRHVYSFRRVKYEVHEVGNGGNKMEVMLRYVVSEDNVVCPLRWLEEGDPWSTKPSGWGLGRSLSSLSTASITAAGLSSSRSSTLLGSGNGPSASNRSLSPAPSSIRTGQSFSQASTFIGSGGSYSELQAGGGSMFSTGNRDDLRVVWLKGERVGVFHFEGVGDGEKKASSGMAGKTKQRALYKAGGINTSRARVFFNAEWLKKAANKPFAFPRNGWYEVYSCSLLEKSLTMPWVLNEVHHFVQVSGEVYKLDGATGNYTVHGIWEDPPYSKLPFLYAVADDGAVCVIDDGEGRGMGKLGTEWKHTNQPVVHALWAGQNVVAGIYSMDAMYPGWVNARFNDDWKSEANTPPHDDHYEIQDDGWGRYYITGSDSRTYTLANEVLH